MSVIIFIVGYYFRICCVFCYFMGIIFKFCALDGLLRFFCFKWGFITSEHESTVYWSSTIIGKVSVWLCWMRIFRSRGHFIWRRKTLLQNQYICRHYSTNYQDLDDTKRWAGANNKGCLLEFGNRWVCGDLLKIKVILKSSKLETRCEAEAKSNDQGTLRRKPWYGPEAILLLQYYYWRSWGRTIEINGKQKWPSASAAQWWNLGEKNHGSHQF